MSKVYLWALLYTVLFCIVSYVIHYVKRIFMHSNEFACYQGNHQNCVSSIVLYKLWLIFMEVKQKFRKIKVANPKNSTPPILIFFFAKIWGICFWLSKIIWCKGHQSVSTYMAVRVSNVSSKKGLKFAGEQKMRIGGVENISLFESAILNYFFSKNVFFSSPWKLVKNCLKVNL